MKTLAIRTFVVALAVAGFSASSMYSASTARNKNEAKVMVVTPSVVSTPSSGVRAWPRLRPRLIRAKLLEK